MGEPALSPVLPPRQDEGKRVPVSYRFPEMILERLREVAKENNYEVTEVILHAVRKFLAEYDADRAAAAAEAAATEKKKR